MPVEEELPKEIPTKTGNNRRNNHQNTDIKASSPKEMHAVNRITKYISKLSQILNSYGSPNTLIQASTANTITHEDTILKIVEISKIG